MRRAEGGRVVTAVEARPRPTRPATGAPAAGAVAAATKAGETSAPAAPVTPAPETGEAATPTRAATVAVEAPTEAREAPASAPAATKVAGSGVKVGQSSGSVIGAGRACCRAGFPGPPEECRERGGARAMEGARGAVGGEARGAPATVPRGRQIVGPARLATRVTGVAS